LEKIELEILHLIELEILHLDLELEGDAEHPDARCGGVTIEVRAFNETNTKYEESRLHAIVVCLKLATSVWRSPQVDFVYAEIFGRIIPETGGLVSV